MEWQTFFISTLKKKKLSKFEKSSICKRKLLSYCLYRTRWSNTHRALFGYAEVKLSILHWVATKGSPDILKLFLLHMKTFPTLEEVHKVFLEKDSFVGLDFINFVCKEGDYEAIKETIMVAKTFIASSQANNGNTCLHSLANNRRLSLVALTMK